MTMYPMATPTEGAHASDESGFNKAARWIGDLDHPFYSDERNRYVWYEASAIGFQLMFLSAYAIAGVMLWIVGSAALPYAIVMLLPAIITAVVLKAYVTRAGADYWPTGADFRRGRGLAAAGVLVVLMSGAMRAAIDFGQGSGDSATSSFSRGLANGTVPGLVVGVIAAIVAGVVVNRSAAKREAAAELIEE